MVGFQVLENLAARRTSSQDPWLIPTPTARPQKCDWNKIDTTHVFYSSFVGLAPTLRVDTKDNPPAHMLALVVDYDSKNITDDMIKNVVNIAGDLKPTYACRTISGGARLIFLFEQPLPIASIHLIKLVLRVMIKRLCLDKLLPGLDRGAVEDPCKYYELGTDWQLLPGANTIPMPFLMQWVTEGVKNFNWKKHEVVIPFDVVEAEIHKQFPGQLGMPLVVGARCRRFWDPDAKNDTSAVVCEAGFICFSDEVGLKTWGMLLGAKFVAQYQADRIGGTITDLFFDGREYWSQLPDELWYPSSRQDALLHLRMLGLDGKPGKGELVAEAEEALHTIQQGQRVEAAAPFVHRPTGLLFMADGRRYLNTSAVRVLLPSDETGIDPYEKCPVTVKWLETVFGTGDQLDSILAWLKRFYEGCYNQDLQPGQTVFIAGDPGSGKTLFGTLFVATLVGGGIDVGGYLTGEQDSGYNSPYFGYALWNMDDQLALKDRKSYERYIGLLKKMAANRLFYVSEKYKTGKQLEWMGRVIVTCNTDLESARILPELDFSNQDKIMLYHAVGEDYPFPDDIAGVLRAEARFFARFLLEMAYPPGTQGTGRYGVKRFHHPFVKELASQGSANHTFLEILRIFMADRPVSEGPWKGNSTQLFTEMSSEASGLRAAMKDFNATRVGIMLGRLERAGYKVRRDRDAHSRLWIIDERPHQGE